MRNRNILPVVFTFVLGAMLLSGCGPRVGADQPNPSDELMVSLPSLVVDVQPDGEIVIDAIPVADLAAAFEQELDIEPLDPSFVDLLMRSNIQHLQVDNAPDGPLLLINGEPIPSIHWSEDSLSTLGLLVELFGAEEMGLGELLPLVRHLGVGLTLRLPLAAGAEPIPLYVTGDGSVASRAETSQDDWLELIGDEPLRLHVGVDYRADGVASLAGINAGLLSNLGIPLNGLNQSPETMQAVADLGIEEISLSSDAAGIVLAVNGHALPSIAWESGEVMHLIEIALQVALQDSLDDPGRGIARTLGIIEKWLPAAQTTELQLAVSFAS